MLPAGRQKIPVRMDGDESLPTRAASRAAFGPKADTAMGGGVSGSEYRREILHRVEGAVMVDQPTVPQGADHLHGLFEHHVPYLHRGPAMTENVLVECLAGAHSEDEPPVQEALRRGRGLGEDDRLNPDRGTVTPAVTL